jgi:hypothetical protein
LVELPAQVALVEQTETFVGHFDRVFPPGRDEEQLGEKLLFGRAYVGALTQCFGRNADGQCRWRIRDFAFVFQLSEQSGGRQAS